MTDEKPRVIIIPPKPELQQTTTVTTQLRVAAYCRVSTKEEEQASSYEAQCEYYTDKIMSNKEWTMAGIFADEGITFKAGDLRGAIQLPQDVISAGQTANPR